MVLVAVLFLALAVAAVWCFQPTPPGAERKSRWQSAVIGALLAVALVCAFFASACFTVRLALTPPAAKAKPQALVPWERRL